MDNNAQRGERGQIIVVFALALVAIVAMVGLILDGGSSFAQRRSEQNAVDLAALAAGNDLIVNQGTADWVGTARTVARQNGFEHGVNGITVDVTCENCPGQVLNSGVAGVQVTVGITAPHQNAFAGVVGMPTWDVSTTATSKTGWPDTATGPAPFILSKEAFDPAGKAKVCSDPANPCNFNHPTTSEGDTPQSATEFAWTDFHYDTPCHVAGNVDDQDLQDYLEFIGELHDHARLRVLHRAAQQRPDEQHHSDAREPRPDHVSGSDRGHERQLRRLGLVRPRKRDSQRVQRGPDRLLRDR